MSRTRVIEIPAVAPPEQDASTWTRTKVSRKEGQTKTVTRTRDKGRLITVVEIEIEEEVVAEEAERLELSMDIIEALVSDDALFVGGWQGFGLALQAYSKRAVPLVDWVVQLGRRNGRRIMVRLVKGAYWDAEWRTARSPRAQHWLAQATPYAGVPTLLAELKSQGLLLGLCSKRHADTALLTHTMYPVLISGNPAELLHLQRLIHAVIHRLDRHHQLCVEGPHIAKR